jgi:hypothetical protein
MRIGVVICLVLACFTHAFSQVIDNENYTLEKTATPVRGFFYTALTMGFPDAQFKQSVDSNFGGSSFGFSSGLGVNPYGERRESPLLLGLDFTYNSFGRDPTTDPITNIQYKTSFNHYFVGPLLRVYPVRGEKIVPFLEGTAGLAILNAKIKTAELDESGAATLIDSENDEGFGFSLGLGLHGNSSAGDSESIQTSFYLRLLYSWGDRLRYVKRNSVSVVDDILNYDTGYTSTNMLQLQIGCIFH